MSAPAFALHAIHHRAIHAQPDIAERIANLLADPRWPWGLAFARPTTKPDAPTYPWPRGKLPHAKLPAIAKEILTSRDTLGIRLVASTTDATNHAYAHIDGGHGDFTGRPDDTAFPFDVRLFCRAHDAIDAWIDLVHELVALVDAPHGVVFAHPDERRLWSLLYTTGSGRTDAPRDHPSNINARIAAARRTLGRHHVRAPEWGTYLSSAHVDEIGRDRLVAAAATSRTVGTLLYLQCSIRAADAFGPEALERRAALANLLAPISVG